MSSTTKHTAYKSVYTLLKQHGVPTSVYLKASREGDPSSIQRVCIPLKRELVAAKKLDGEGRSTAVSNGELVRQSDINECLITLLLAAKDQKVGSLPMLVEMILEQLGVASRMDFLEAPKPRARDRRKLGAIAVAADSEASLRQIGKLVGVSRQTVSDWKNDALFSYEVDQLRNEHSAEQLQALFDEHQKNSNHVQTEFLITFYKLSMEAAWEELSGN